MDDQRGGADDGLGVVDVSGGGTWDSEPRADERASADVVRVALTCGCRAAREPRC